RGAFAKKKKVCNATRFSFSHINVLWCLCSLSSCQLDSEGLGHLAGILAKCPQIEEIKLKFCGISDRASKTLIVGLSCCPFLEEIV
ncbi:hypothetical protein E2320_001039, partial [Naja naja]